MASSGTAEKGSAVDLAELERMLALLPVVDDIEGARAVVVAVTPARDIELLCIDASSSDVEAPPGAQVLASGWGTDGFSVGGLDRWAVVVLRDTTFGVIRVGDAARRARARERSAVFLDLVDTPEPILHAHAHLAGEALDGGRCAPCETAAAARGPASRARSAAMREARARGR